MAEIRFKTWSRPISGRFLVLLVVLFTIIILSFNAATDPAHISEDLLLDGSDYIGYAVCHRLSDRSFEIGGRQLPLCARCTGIYLGITLTFSVLFFAGRKRWSLLPPTPIFATLVLFVTLMGIDGLNSYSHFFSNAPHLYEPQNWLRLITGMGTGLALGLVVFPSLAQTLWHEQVMRPSIASFKELAMLVFLAGVLALLVLSNQPTILYVLGIVSAAGVLATLTALNTMTLLIVTKRDARGNSLRDVALPLVAGMLLALAVVATISWIRFSLTGTMSGLPGL